MHSEHLFFLVFLINLLTKPHHSFMYTLSCNMPPKKTPMGRNKLDAKSMAVFKSLETQEQTQAQLEDQRARQAASMSIETTEQTQVWVEDQCARQTASRAACWASLEAVAHAQGPGDKCVPQRKIYLLLKCSIPCLGAGFGLILLQGSAVRSPTLKRCMTVVQFSRRESGWRCETKR